MNVDGVPKPAYRAYELLHRLGDRIFHVEGVHPTVDAWVTRRGEEVTVLLTNGALPRHRIRAERVHVTLDGVLRAARAFVERIDDEHANAKQADRNGPTTPPEPDAGDGARDRIGAGSRSVAARTSGRPRCIRRHHASHAELR